MQAGGGHLAAGPEPGDRAPARGVHRDAAHVEVRRRHHRDRLPGRVEPGPRQAAVMRREARAKAGPSASRASRKTRCPGCDRRQTRARHHVRGASSAPGMSARKRSPGLVDQHRAFAAHRLADQRQRVEPGVQRRRVELHELQVGSTAPARAASTSPWPKAPSRVGRMQVNPPTPPVASTTRLAGRAPRHLARDCQHARTRVVLDEQPPRLGGLQKREVGAARTAAARARRISRAGAVAAGMHDPATAMRRLQAQCQRTIGAAVEADAVPEQRRDRRRPAPHHPRRRGRVAQPVASGQRVWQMQRRAVVRRRWPRRSLPAPRRWRRRCRAAPAASTHHRRRCRQLQRRRSARRARRR